MLHVHSLPRIYTTHICWCASRSWRSLLSPEQVQTLESPWNQAEPESSLKKDSKHVTYTVGSQRKKHLCIKSHKPVFLFNSTLLVHRENTEYINLPVHFHLTGFDLPHMRKPGTYINTNLLWLLSATNKTCDTLSTSLTWWWSCSCPCSEYSRASSHLSSAECPWTLCSLTPDRSVYIQALFLPCHAIHFNIFLWQESGSTIEKGSVIWFESNTFVSKPTRSDKVSVPATSQNCFIVSKATQYRAINLPASAEQK